MNYHWLRGFALLTIVSALVAGCGDDDDDDNGGGSQNCAQFPDPCDSCTCRACPCDSACQKASVAVADCVAACFTQDGGDPFACIESCTSQLSGSTRTFFQCTQSAVGNQCASSCGS